MKKIVVSTLLLFSIMAYAQNDDPKDTTAQSSITEPGKPEGRIAEMMINNKGGTLVSADGSLELIIPPGALSKKTNISIQPLSNTMPNGNGQSYRLEPSGTKFQQPLQLVFHYNDEESSGNMQLLMGIAMQDDSGQWFSLKNFTLDTVAKTISGNINHFSAWSKFDKIKLYPGYAKLKVKKNMTLYINLISTEQENENDDDLMQLSPRRIPWKATWLANAIVNGNSTEGKISVNSKTTITYTAPDKLPSKNSVEVSAELKGIDYTTTVNNRKEVFNDLKLVSEILIYDVAYEIKMTGSINEAAGSVLGAVTYSDEGSFVVSLESGKAKLIEKVNKNVPDKLDYHGNCIIKQLKPGSGNIHIIGIIEPIIVTPATSTEPAKIRIIFKPAKVILPLLQFDCPPIHKGNRYVSTNGEARAMVAKVLLAFPVVVEFEAKEGEQDVPTGILLGMKFKITAKQLKDD